MSDPSNHFPYFPPPDLVAAAEDLLTKARPEELHTAACAYDSYGTLGGRVYVASDKLPPFEACAVLTRARWLSVVRTVTQCGAPLLPQPGDKQTAKEGGVGSESGAGLKVGEMAIRVDTSGLGQEMDRLERLIDSVGHQDSDDEGQVDPFILGLGAIAAATKDLAEASRVAVTSPHNGVLGDLISTITGALHERVKALALPSTP